jgi:DNA-binding NtrC family response regulator
MADEREYTPNHYSWGKRMRESFGMGRRVLVVDDEAPISDSLAMILSHSGFAAKTATSGEQAVEIARVFQPELLISDVVMGGISGIEAATEILTFLPNCKVILFSGQATTLDLLRRSHTADHYEILAKPIPPDILLDRIAKLV